MSATNTAYFRDLARELEVEESDFLIISADGRNTAEKLFFALPSTEAVERLVGRLQTHGAHMDGAELRIWERAGQEEQFRRSNAWLDSASAGNVRRLYAYCKEMAKRHIERETAADRVGTSARALDVYETRKFREEFVRDNPSFDTSLHLFPGPECAGRVRRMASPSVPKVHLVWESYTSEEMELRHSRDRKRLADGSLKSGAVSLRVGSQGAITAEDEAKPGMRPHVGDPLDLHDVLHIRAAAWAGVRGAGGLPLLSVDVSNKYNSCLKVALRKEVPVGFRRPSLAEVRRFDRDFFTQVFDRVNRGDGILQVVFEEALASKSSIWTLLEEVPQDHPDRGILHSPRPALQPNAYGFGVRGSSADLSTGAVEPGKCSVCGLPRGEHPGRNYCQFGGKAPRVGKAAAPPAGGKGKGQPQWMEGHSLKTEDNKAICFLFHGPGGCRRGDQCWASHSCPKRLRSGKICGGSHAVSECRKE